jgi:hypothetical protein
MHDTILFWAQRAGSELQTSFFSAVESGDVKQVEALMHPALRKKIDPPILEAWMQEVRGKLGRFQGLSKTDFSTSTKYQGGKKLTESKGTVNFEHGTATSELEFQDDQLVAFSIRSDKIGDDWFKGPTDSTFYRERGQQFLTHFLNGEAEQAFSMMHESLQKAMPLEKLKTLMTGVTAKAGRLQSIAHTEDRFDASKGQRLKVLYQVKCANSQTTAQIDFQFVGLKGGF